MPLTSQIKELGAIYTFGIKNWLNHEPGIIPGRKWDNDGLVVGDADVLDWQGLGSVQQRNETIFVLSQELEKWENKAVLSLCLDV